MKIPEELRLFAALVLFVALCGFSTHSKADEKPVDHEIKIFSLVNANSGSMVKLIANLMSSGDYDLRLEADARTNAIICKGPPAVLREIEAILMKLDQQVQGNAKDEKIAAAARFSPESVAKKARKSALSRLAIGISSPASGRISQLLKEGSQVKKGEILAVVDAKKAVERKLEVERTVALAKARNAEMEGAAIDLELELNMAKKSHQVATMNLEFAQAKANTETAALETELANANAKAAALMDRARILEEQNARGTAATTDVLFARVEAETAKGSIELLKLQLALQKNSAAPLQIAVAEMEFLEAEHLMQKLKREAVELQRKRAADVSAMEWLKKLQDEAAQRTPQKHEVIAPAAGIVTYDNRQLSVGSQVRSNQALFKLTREAGDAPKN